jgi:hypothetical protein
MKRRKPKPRKRRPHWADQARDRILTRANALARQGKPVPVTKELRKELDKREPGWSET